MGYKLHTLRLYMPLHTLIKTTCAFILHLATIEV